MTKDGRREYVVLLLLALAVVYIVGNLLAFNLAAAIEKKIDVVRPAKIELVTIADLSCASCVDFSNAARGFPKDKIDVVKERQLDWTSAEAKQLIEKYSLEAVPALIITGELSRKQATEFFASVGLSPKNNSLIVQGLPPFRDLKTGKIVGLVTLTLVNDTTCVECYDVNVNKAILQRFGVVVKSAQTHDASSEQGKKLVAQYNITKIPTVIMSPDAQAYRQFLQIWSQVGSVEADGSLVFRSPEVLGAYKDLASGQIIKAQQ